MVFYENMLAVNNISLRCEEGTVVGVFGANAAGKTSLMRATSGLLLDMKKKEAMRGGERIAVLGEIRFNGEEIGDLGPSQRARRGLILCPERRRIFPESSVLENLKIGGHLASRSQAKRTLATPSPDGTAEAAAIGRTAARPQPDHAVQPRGGHPEDS
jgi:branched-chain amino acid transport system ATP-binding protein